ncbi:MAG: hypothetical protein AB1498_05435 [bacterium]
MNRNIFILILIAFCVTRVVSGQGREELQENIGYRFYASNAPIYHFLTNVENKKGEIFIDWEDNLYIVDSEGTFLYNSKAELVNKMAERIQIPLKADSFGNIYILQENKIKKMSPQKELLSSFPIDEDSRLVHIDDKSNYYFISLRKEFKTDEYNEELRKIEEKQRELTYPAGVADELRKVSQRYNYVVVPGEITDMGDVDAIDRRLYDYKLEARDSTYALESLRIENSNLWKALEFETSAATRVNIRQKADDTLNRMLRVQDRLAFIAKDIDDLNYRKRLLLLNRERELKSKETEDREEYARLNDEKQRIKKSIEEDFKMKYEIRVYTSDKYLINNYPIPLPQEGIPLFSCHLIVSDRKGNFYGSDGKNVYIYDWEGNLLASFGNPGDYKGGIKAVSWLAVDSKMNIYVSDPLNNKILKFGLEKPVLNSIH